MKLFRRIIDPTEPGPEAEMVKAACRRRMNLSIWIMVVLGALLIAVIVVMRIVPDLIGKAGDDLLVVVVVLILLQVSDWINEYLRLKKLTRISDT